MKCPRCKCIVTNNSISCLYCGYQFVPTETITTHKYYEYPGNVYQDTTFQIKENVDVLPNNTCFFDNIDSDSKETLLLSLIGILDIYSLIIFLFMLLVLI